MKKFIKSFTNTIAIVSGLMIAIIAIDKCISLFKKVKDKFKTNEKENSACE